MKVFVVIAQFVVLFDSFGTFFILECEKDVDWGDEPFIICFNILEVDNFALNLALLFPILLHNRISSVL